jgi:hypothetical protein
MEDLAAKLFFLLMRHLVASQINPLAKDEEKENKMKNKIDQKRKK